MNKVLGTSDIAEIARVSNSGFNFPVPRGDRGTFVIQFDHRASNLIASSVAWVGVGADANADATLDSNERAVGMALYLGGIYATTQTGAIWSDANRKGSLTAICSDNEWVRFRAVLELGTAPSAGQLHIEYMNLSRGETAFTTVGGPTEVVFSTNVALPPSWDTIAVALNAANEIDNIVLTATEPEIGTRLTNMSTRAWVDGTPVTGGFVIDGPSPKRVIVRAAGPALAMFGVQGHLPDPAFTVYRDGVEIAAADNWSASASDAALLAQVFVEVGAFDFALGSTDAAIVLNLDPGPYTFAVRDANGGVGEVLVEAYTVRE